METPSWPWVPYFTAWLATLALILLSLRLRRRQKLYLPPGPKPWPIIGNLNLIGSLPHRSIHALSQNAKRLESYEYIRREEMKLLLKGLYESSGKPIVLKDNLSDLSLNVISRMVLGKKYTDGTGENEIVTPKEFKEMLDELFLLNGVLDIGDSIPWLRFLDLQGNIKRMKALSKKFDRFLEHVLDEHNARRREIKDYVAKDMVDVLLQLAEDPNLDVKLERHGVKAFSQDLIAGGTESSAVTVEWAISEIWKLPSNVAKEDLNMEEIFGLSTPKKYPLETVAEPRLPIHLYSH
ncbi:hypothetical protein V6N13_033850 [Hibiscus sabdariffa]